MLWFRAWPLIRMLGFRIASQSRKAKIRQDGVAAWVLRFGLHALNRCWLDKTTNEVARTGATLRQ